MHWRSRLEEMNDDIIIDGPRNCLEERCMGKDREDDYTVVMKRTMSECAVRSTLYIMLGWYKLTNRKFKKTIILYCYSLTFTPLSLLPVHMCLT